MTWNHAVCFIVPIALQEVAKKVSRSLDPDVGGYEAFELYLSADGNQPATHVAYSTPCKESFIDILAAVEADPSVLHGLVVADYAARWPEEVVPTEAECLSFCSGLVKAVDTPLEVVLSDNSLVFVHVD